MITTIRETYIALLTECNKQKSPSLLLEDFNYFYSKAVQLYLNKRLNVFPIGQQVRDDLGVLLIPNHVIDVIGSTVSFPPLFVVDLPENYFHLERCNPEIVVANTSLGCTSAVGTLSYPTCAPITAQELSVIAQDYYMKPSFTSTYYSIAGTAGSGTNTSPTKPQFRLYLYCGSDTTKTLNKVYIDYFRVPSKITLLEDDLYSQLDTSSVLEFPPYVNQEILNELLKLIMENTTDPRLGTAAQINQSIGLPAILQNQK